MEGAGVLAPNFSETMLNLLLRMSPINRWSHFFG
jgi:hypothetical protein